MTQTSILADGRNRIEPGAVLNGTEGTGISEVVTMANHVAAVHAIAHRNNLQHGITARDGHYYYAVKVAFDEHPDSAFSQLSDKIALRASTSDDMEFAVDGSFVIFYLGTGSQLNNKLAAGARMSCFPFKQ